MPIWLEVTFSFLSALSIILSIYTIITTKFKNRLTSKTIDLQEIIFGETKYSYDDNNYLKHIKVTIVLHNSTEKSFLLSKCNISNYAFCKKRIINDKELNDTVLGIKIPPASSVEIDGIISIDYKVDIKTLKPIILTFSNNKQLVYSTIKQIHDEPN